MDKDKSRNTRRNRDTKSKDKVNKSKFEEPKEGLHTFVDRVQRKKGGTVIKTLKNRNIRETKPI